MSDEIPWEWKYEFKEKRKDVKSPTAEEERLWLVLIW